MSNLLSIAKMYHALGFNVIPVAGKRATAPWTRWQAERQTSEQFAGQDWATATGAAAISGPVSGGLAAIDLDGVSGDSPLHSALGLLGLPKEYAWSVKTPGHGGGWHIWVLCPDLWDTLEGAGVPIKSVLV